MNERIKKIRRALDLTQEEFAARIGVKRNTVATYEMGRSVPSDSALSLICREFGVNMEWLRTGAGEMFQENKGDSLEELLKSADLSDGDRLLIAKFLSLGPSERQVVLKYVLSVAAEYAGPVPDKAEAPEPDSLEAQADAFAAMAREQFLSEKKREAQASFVKESDAG